MDVDLSTPLIKNFYCRDLSLTCETLLAGWR
jgi:hypothetical protein